MRKTLVAVSVLLAMSASGALAAVQVCASWKQLTHQLYTQHGEVLVAQGIGINGILYSVMAAPTGGWSILATRANDKVTCIMAIGKPDATWHVIEPTAIRQD